MAGAGTGSRPWAVRTVPLPTVTGEAHTVQGPHLVEVDLPHRHAVGRRLRLSDAPVDLHSPVPHRLGQVKAADHLPDIPQGAVVMVLMVMIVVVMSLLPAVDYHPHVCAGDALAGDGLRRQCHAGEEAVHVPEKALPVRAQLIEGPHEHIPGRAHGALQIQCLHWSIPFIWLIR